MNVPVEVAGGVWVGVSERFVTNTTVVRLDAEACLVVDPAVDPPDLADVVGWIASESLEVAAGWSTHPHWDHVLWCTGLGADAPRYSTHDNAELCKARRSELIAHLDGSSPGHELDLCGRLTGVEPAAFGALSAHGCRVVEHSAHAPGHGALLFSDLGVFLAGDMVSDVEIPLLDSEAGDPLGDYLSALELYEELVGNVGVFVPGHGGHGDGAELGRRIEQDRAYLAGLAAGRPADDPRLATPWLALEHERHVKLVARTSRS